MKMYDTVYLDHKSYLVFCAHIQHDRQTLLWRHPPARRVQRQLAHRDAHPITAQVSEAQDPLSIRHTNSLSINTTLGV